MKASPVLNYPFFSVSKLLFWSLLLPMLVTLFSCADSNDTPKASSEYYLKFKANGKQYLIESGRQMGYVTCGFVGETQFGVSGIGIPGPEPALYFAVKDVARITTKEYKLNDLPGNQQWPMIATLPIDDVIKKYEYYDNGKDIVVNIKEITTVFVKGTFSGVMLNGSGMEMKITEGEFSAERMD